ncbi:MAG: transporter substrate-binding domain-containing protein [Crocinitomicaceae bacterium]
MIRFFFLLSLTLLISCKEEVVTVEKEPCRRTWKDIQEEGVIRVLAENSPASYFIYRGRNMGFEYEMLHEFAKDIDMELKVQMVNDLDEMYDLLCNCKGDIVAAHLTVTDKRKKLIDFSTPHLVTHDVLVQRIPHDTDTVNVLITEIEQLKNKTLHIWKSSSFYDNIQKINRSLNLNMTIVATEGAMITEELMRQVSEGEIDYTIADQSVAQIDMNYYDNLDISLKLSQDNEIAFALRKNSGTLLDTLNFWLNDRSNRSTIGEVKRKYFDRKNLSRKANQPYSSLKKEGELSPYDEIIKEECKKIGWDWRLISAIIYQESKFENWKVSWAGAFGIFQFMPATAASYEISRNSSAEAQIRAGIRKLNKNYKQWLKEIPDSTEAIKFTLANYNAGRSHIDDARALCEKYNCDPNVWTGEVDEMLLNLSKPKYYRDKVVKYGYCRGTETYNYVIEILRRFEEYKSAFPEEGDK